MSKIALAHGAHIDKFIGDAMLMFFGDPETKGFEEDARACVRMERWLPVASHKVWIFPRRSRHSFCVA